MSIVTYENVDTPVFELDTMRYLFRDGLQGMWIDFRQGYVFADTDLTIAPAPGEGIAGYVDRGPYGNDGTQPVITARPILGRVPRTGRRNLLLHTEGYSQWNTFSGETTLTPGVDDPFGGNGAVRITGISGSGRFGIPAQIEPGVAVQSFWCRSVGPVLAETGNRYRSASGGQVGSAYFGTQLVEDEWVEVEMPVEISGSPAQLTMRVLDATCDFYFPQHELGTVKTPYQRVTTEYDVTEAGVPSVYYAHYDGADDVLPQDADVPIINEGCFILVGRKGIWIDNNYQNLTGKLTVGPTTYTGGPEGILPVVGNILSIIWRDEPLTAQERQKVIQAGVKRGSAGLIELGPERVPNPGDPFTTDSGWLASPSAPGGTVIASGGELVVGNPEEQSPPVASCNVGDLSGRTLLIDVEITSTDLIGQCRVGWVSEVNTTGVPQTVYSSGQMVVGRNRKFVPGATLARLAVGGRGDVNEVKYSKISLREVILP